MEFILGLVLLFQGLTGLVTALKKDAKHETRGPRFQGPGIRPNWLLCWPESRNSPLD
jgi:hypothetical protein